MIFPIGDFPNPRGFVPLVTYLLIFLNVFVYFYVTLPLGAEPAPPGPGLSEYVRVMSEALAGRVDPAVVFRHVSVYDLFVFEHGFRPAAPSLSDLFFSMFLHGSFFHLAGNMLFLWIFGDNVEHRLGRAQFLVAYLATGVAATAFHAITTPGSQVPMVGASGAISGALGFYFVFFPRNLVRLLWMFPPFLYRVFTVPARVVLGLYLVFDNLLPYLLTSSDVGVAHGAHIGGFVAGLAWAWAIDRKEVAGTPKEFVHDDARAHLPGAAVREALLARRFDDAARGYFDLSPHESRGVLQPAESLALAAWLERSGYAKAALTVLRRHVRDFPDGPRLDEALVAAGRILLEQVGEPTAAYQKFLQALDLDPEPRLAREARAGIARIEAM